jgi:hypothetical protein
LAYVNLVKDQNGRAAVNTHPTNGRCVSQQMCQAHQRRWVDPRRPLSAMSLRAFNSGIHAATFDVGGLSRSRREGGIGGGTAR